MLERTRVMACFCLGFLMAVLLTLPDPVEGRMWAGVQAGANFVAASDIAQGGVTTYQNVQFEPTFLGGLTLGYDFVPEGFLGYNWPTWMQYFSFALDFTYHNLDIRRQQVRTVSESGSPGTAGLPRGSRQDVHHHPPAHR